MSLMMEQSLIYQITDKEICQARRRLPSGHRFFYDCERETYARFIEWSTAVRGDDAWFVTLTFRDYKSPYYAKKMRDRWLSRLNLALMDTTRGGRLRWICASEWQVRDVIHFHLLLVGCDLRLLSRKRWESRWESNGGGFCRIYDAVMKSAPYLAKYMNKSKGGELEWGGSWLGLTVPASVACGCTEVPQQFGMGQRVYASV